MSATSRQRRYRLWYMGRSVVLLKWDWIRGLWKITAGDGEPVIMRGGPALDFILGNALAKGIEEFTAEPIG